MLKWLLADLLFIAPYSPGGARKQRHSAQPSLSADRKDHATAEENVMSLHDSNLVIKMATDWKLIRRLVNSALDACESLDTLKIREQEHGVHLTGHGSPVSSVFDALQSAHVFPESVRYALIRARGHLGDAPPFVQPISRVLQQVGAVCAELVGAEQLTTPVKGIDPRGRALGCGGD